MDKPKSGAAKPAMVKPPAKKAAAKPKPAAPKKTSKKNVAPAPELIELPIVPLKDLVVFPRMILPLFVARQPSVKAIDQALTHDSQVAVVCQRRDSHAYPGTQDLPEVGTLAQLLQTLRMPDGSVKVMVECRTRIKLVRYLKRKPFMVGQFEIIEEPEEPLRPEQEVLVKLMLKQFEHFMQLSHQLFPEAAEQIPAIHDPGPLADMIVSYIAASVEEKQQILEIIDPIARLEAAGRLLSRAMEMATIEQQIHSKLRQSIDKNQKEYFLREKLRAIREELGEEEEAEQREYDVKIRAIPVAEVREKALKELSRLDKMPPVSSEGSVIRNYLDLIVSLPWAPEEPAEMDLKAASALLDKQHYGLHKVKDRILEYLAVRKLTGKAQNTLLCLTGPPGVGKTSLCRSIAEATGRKFERIALGGVGDDSEIRGHRRTYVGALPGRIIQAIQRAGTTNLVILLDEVDKLTRNIHGDPASALLEVLDPEQNEAFRDHYLDLPFDISNVLFLCAGNVAQNMPRPLLDRMQLVQLSGYTQEEKQAIAKQHLLPKQLGQTGLKKQKIVLTKPALTFLIQRYTRESGVRELERQIGNVLRRLARMHVQGDEYPQRITSAESVQALLGPPKYSPSQVDHLSEVGLVRGLAWTETGGSVLPIEITLSPGKGKLVTTGNLGDVMKESMQIALGFVRHQAADLGIDAELFQTRDIHIHVPEGAIPKDGPSAGIAITTALVSSFTGQPVSAKVAMTGEITLRGKVLPIGGVKEKSLAAYREGIRTVLIPKDNEPDLAEIPEEIRKKITFVPVSDITQVLELAILHGKA
jgi:ATP-dependent Lon protease